MDTLIGLLVGLISGGVLFWALRRSRSPSMRIDTRSAILQLRSVGELVAFRMINQQIVTAEQHAAARAEADTKAGLYAQQLQSEARSSAKQTLEALVHALGIEHIEIEFPDSQPPAPVATADLPASRNSAT